MKFRSNFSLAALLASNSLSINNFLLAIEKDTLLWGLPCQESFGMRTVDQ